MANFIGLIERDAVPVVERMAAFTEARQRVLAENVANVTTPGYRTKQVDVRAFQHELRRAADARESPAAPLRMKSTGDARIDASGRLTLEPSLEPADNALLHDGTNARVERMMADVAENAYMHQISTELLRGNYGTLLTAIRGRVS